MGANTYQLTVLTDLSVLPQAIESNYEEVKAALQGVLQKYDGLVVTDENFREMKDTRAGINKGIEALKTVGRDVKNRLLAPYAPFDAKVKELAGLAVEKRDGIDAQIKEIEARRRREKRERIGALLAESVSKFGLGRYAGCDHFRTLVDRHPQWLNETVSLKRATAEMEAEVGRCADVAAQVARIYEGETEVVRVKAEQLVPVCAFDIGAVCERVNAFKAEEERLAEARRRDEEVRRRREEELALRRRQEELAAREAVSRPPTVAPSLSSAGRTPASAHAPAPAPAVPPSTPPSAPAARMDPMQAAMAALRSVRAEIHGSAAAPSPAPAPAPAVPPPAPKPDVWRLTMRFEAPMDDLAALKEFLDARGVRYEMVGDAERVEETAQPVSGAGFGRGA